MARGRLTELAYTRVRDGILRGELAPGSVLDERHLAESVGSSRTPVRQALGYLLQEGLLEIGPRRQVLVRGFTPSHRREIFLLREALETVAVRRACEVMEIEELDELRLLIMRQRRAARDGLNDEFVDLDEQFHLLIARGARMPILQAFLGQIGGFVRLARFGTTRSPAVLNEVVAEHEQIVDALEARDVSTALTTLSEHLARRDYGERREPTKRMPAGEILR